MAIKRTELIRFLTLKFFNQISCYVRNIRCGEQMIASANYAQAQHTPQNA